MRAADIAELDQRARRLFTYQKDPAERDTWRSWADQVLAGEHWSGDCDDLASTVLDMLGRAGVPADRRFRLLVDSSRSGGIDHMAGAVFDDAGRVWIVGDTFGRAYEPDRFLHRPVAYQRLDEWTGSEPVWRDGAPWSV